MTIHYSPTVRGGGPSSTAENYGWASNADWHVTASNDAGASHILNGRLYLVQCLWCPDAFAGNTKAEAMSMFREHEEEMAERADHENKIARDHKSVGTSLPAETPAELIVRAWAVHDAAGRIPHGTMVHETQWLPFAQLYNVAERLIEALEESEHERTAVTKLSKLREEATSWLNAHPKFDSKQSIDHRKELAGIVIDILDGADPLHIDALRRSSELCLQCNETRSTVKANQYICGLMSGGESPELGDEWPKHRWASWTDKELGSMGVAAEAFARHRRTHIMNFRWIACEDTVRGHVPATDLEFATEIGQCIVCGQKEVPHD